MFNFIDITQQLDFSMIPLFSSYLCKSVNRFENYTRVSCHKPAQTYAKHPNS